MEILKDFGVMAGIIMVLAIGVSVVAIYLSVSLKLIHSIFILSVAIAPVYYLGWWGIVVSFGCLVYIGKYIEKRKKDIE